VPPEPEVVELLPQAASASAAVIATSTSISRGARRRDARRRGARRRGASRWGARSVFGRGKRIGVLSS
jgi:hypothetical protein